MTKEQVQKHGEVIKWFIDNSDKGVWFKHISGSKWDKTIFPLFDVCNTYVQNDEYVEFRKAIIDEKQLQLNVAYDVGNPEWRDTPIENATHSEFFKVWKPELIRIKPEEHKFKVGDWIENTHLQKIDKFFEDDIDDLNENQPHTYIKLCEPKEDEFVVYQKDTDRYEVCKYSKYTNARTGALPLEFLQSLMVNR